MPNTGHGGCQQRAIHAISDRYLGAIGCNQLCGAGGLALEFLDELLDRHYRAFQVEYVRSFEWGKKAFDERPGNIFNVLKVHKACKPDLERTPQCDGFDCE